MIAFNVIFVLQWLYLFFESFNFKNEYVQKGIQILKIIACQWKKATNESINENDLKVLAKVDNLKEKRKSKLLNPRSKTKTKNRKVTIKSVLKKSKNKRLNGKIRRNIFRESSKA